jgi:uncharacterized protein YycO
MVNTELREDERNQCTSNDGGNRIYEKDGENLETRFPTRSRKAWHEDESNAQLGKLSQSNSKGLNDIDAVGTGITEGARKMNLNFENRRNNVAICWKWCRV